MFFLRTFKLLIISTIIFCFCQSCTTKKSISHYDSTDSVVIVDSLFNSQSLNENVLVSTVFSKKNINCRNLKDCFKHNSDEVSVRNDGILMGSFRKCPDVWFYTNIINISNKYQQIVVEESDKIRCDAFDVFVHNNGALTNLGRIDRSTPFNMYPLPFFTYAVPITIQPKDTIELLINSQRHYGIHEVNLKIYNYSNYLSEEIFNFLSKIFQSVVLIICAVILFILGRIFGNIVMIYLGIYIVSLLYLHLSTWGVTFTMGNFSNIGLSGKNVSTFSTFVSCAAVHPFLNEWMRIVPKNEKIFKIISYSLMSFCLICVLCFLFPIRLFNYIYSYIDFTILWILTIILTLAWIYYCALLAIVRVRVYYIFIGFGIGFLPLSIKQLSIFFSKAPYFLFKTSVSFIVFAALGLSIICIYLLREQLVTRKKLEENLEHIKESMEDIRKNEIEVIGRNLHDNVGNILASALGYLNLKKNNIAVTENLVKEAIHEIRFLSHNLVKDEDIPLLQKLEMLVNRFNDFSEILFVFENYSEDLINKLDKITQQNIYMISQEILTNIVKHSNANEAYYQIFERDDKTVQFTIEDDGIGMGSFIENSGIGLKNIRKRALLSNLKLTIDSTPAGTNFIIETPKIR